MFHLQTKNVTKALTTFVVSASVSHTSVQNLADPVVISLQHVGGNQVTYPFSPRNRKASEPLVNFLLNTIGYLTYVILRLNEDRPIPDSRDVL